MLNIIKESLPSPIYLLQVLIYFSGIMTKIKLMPKRGGISKYKCSLWLCG